MAKPKTRKSAKPKEIDVKEAPSLSEAEDEKFEEEEKKKLKKQSDKATHTQVKEAKKRHGFSSASDCAERASTAFLRRPGRQPGWTDWPLRAKARAPCHQTNYMMRRQTPGWPGQAGIILCSSGPF